MLHKTRSWVLLVCAWVIFLAPAGTLPHAQSTDTNEFRAYKIGVVDVNKVFNEYQKQIDERAKLEKEKDEQQAKLDVLQKKISDAQELLAANAQSTSKDEAEAIRETIRSDLDSYEDEFTQAKRDLERKEAKVSATLLVDVRKAVEKVGSTENYHLILEVGLASRSNVLYHSTTLNMTQKIIDYLNTNYKKP